MLVKVERMRRAILENIHVQYARRPFNQHVPNPGNFSIQLKKSLNFFLVLPYPSAGLVPAGYTQPPPTQSDRPPQRQGQRRAVSARGGQLEVAGVVVCSWGPNYSLARDRNQDFRGLVRNYFDRPGYAHHGRGGFPARRRINSARGPKGKHRGKKTNWNRASNEATPRQDEPSTSGSEESNTEDAGVTTTTTDETA